MRTTRAELVRWTVAVGAVAAVLAAGLDSPAGGSITDERLYLGVLADLRAHGAWFTPTLDGVPDFTKPPLLYWAGLLSLAAFGPSLWAARLPVALSALLLALTAGRLARRWGGQAAAVRGLLLCGTCLGVLRYGRLFMMDIPLALTVALGIEAALAAVEEERPWLLLGSGLAAGAAALLKGPVGPCLIGGVALVLLLARARWMLRSPAVPAALAVAALVALPWFVGMAVVHGRPFLERFLLVEHLGKLTVPWTLSRAGLLVGSLGLFCLPWLPLVRWRPADASLRLLVLAWVGLVLGLFLVPGYKMQQYVVPALLPVLLLAACTPPRAGACRAVGVLLAVLALAAFAMLRLPFGGGTGAALVAEAVLLGLSAALLWRGRPDASAVVVAGAGVLAFAVLLPAVNPAEPGDAPWPDAGHVIYVYRDEPILLARLSGRQVRRVTHWDRILEEARPGDAVVMPAADVASLPPELSAALQPLASWPRLRSPVLAAGMWRALRTGELGPIQEPVALLSVRGRPER